MHDLRDAVSFHQMLLSANGASSATLNLYRIYELAFLEFLHARRVAPGLAELNPRRVTDFLIWYRNEPRGNRSRGGEVAVKTAATVLKRLGAVLEENEYVPDNPLRKLARPRITKHLRQPFTQAEVNALWGACFRTQAPARDEALFLLLLDTGMRIGEATSLRLDQLDLAQGQVTIMGKGRRERVVPIGDQSRADGGRVTRALKRWLTVRGQSTVRPDGEPFVFLTRDGHGLRPEGGNEVIKRLGVLAGVDDVYPHRIRHSYCTFYLTVYAGDELGLRRIVGHLSKDVLADYTHFAETTIAQRHGRASLAEAWLSGARSVAALQPTGYPVARGSPVAATVEASEWAPRQERSTPHAKAGPRTNRRP